MARTFELRGINHLALVCRDMARTVEFYKDGAAKTNVVRSQTPSPVAVSAERAASPGDTRYAGLVQIVGTGI